MEKNFYEKLIPSDKARSVITRLVKAFIGGALGNLALLTIIMPRNWQDITSVIAMVSFACVAGGITGVLLCLQKWYSWKEVEH